MRVQLYSWAPVFFVNHLDVQLRHLPPETKAKSVVSAVATGLRQEAELGDVGIQIEKATLGRDKQHPEEEKEIQVAKVAGLRNIGRFDPDILREALRSSEHERDEDEETHDEDQQKLRWRISRDSIGNYHLFPHKCS